MSTTARLYVLLSSLLLSLHAHLSVQANDQKEPPKEVKIRQIGIQLETKTGKLDGTLDLPEDDGPFPLVISIAGSGPTDRDGNQPGIKLDYLKQLGHALARRGIAVLRYERRGVAKSEAPQLKQQDVRFEMFVVDVVAWVKLLRKDHRFSRIGIMGHSRGSLVGILAARNVKVDAFVSLAGIGRRTHEVLREQFRKNLPKSSKESDKLLEELAAGRTMDPPKSLATQFPPSIQPFLISLFKYDPAREIAELKIPVLIVQGTSDRLHQVDEAKLLAQANKNAELCVINGMNHILKNSILTELFGAKAPLAPELVDRVSAFLKKSLRVSR